MTRWLARPDLHARFRQLIARAEQAHEAHLARVAAGPPPRRARPLTLAAWKRLMARAAKGAGAPAGGPVVRSRR